MKTLVTVFLFAGWVLCGVEVSAQTSVVTSFSGNGDIVWSNSAPSGGYRIQWNSSLDGDGPWQQSWQADDYIEAGSSSIMTSRVPMFYRVVSIPTQQVNGLALVDAGPFQMGDEHGYEAKALPVHTVHLDTFYIDKYEIGVAKWWQVRNWAATNSYTFFNTGGGYETNHPVTDVEWFDCVLWCNARSEMDGLDPVYYVSGSIYKSATLRVYLDNADVHWEMNGYRLPTEAEWEKASRGGLIGHHYPWEGSSSAFLSIDGKKANFNGSGDPYDSVGHTTPVGYYNGNQITLNAPGGPDMANGYGLYDMAGNVWEWCWDRSNAYSSATATNPMSPDGDTFARRILRSGSWAMDELNVRSSTRHYALPDNEHSSFGFRCVRRP